MKQPQQGRKKNVGRQGNGIGLTDEGPPVTLGLKELFLDKWKYNAHNKFFQNGNYMHGNTIFTVDVHDLFHGKWKRGQLE